MQLNGDNLLFFSEGFFFGLERRFTRTWLYQFCYGVHWVPHDLKGSVTFHWHTPLISLVSKRNISRKCIAPQQNRIKNKNAIDSRRRGRSPPIRTRRTYSQSEGVVVFFSCSSMSLFVSFSCWGLADECLHRLCWLVDRWTQSASIWEGTLKIEAPFSRATFRHAITARERKWKRERPLRNATPNRNETKTKKTSRAIESVELFGQFRRLRIQRSPVTPVAANKRTPHCESGHLRLFFVKDGTR